MKWKWILPLAAAFVLQAAGAQELRVVSFEEKTDDIRGRTREKKDLNGDPCALICVELPMPEVQFDGWVIEQQALPGEYLVYVPEGTKKLIIRQGSITPFVYQFDQKLIGKHTYRLRLQLLSGNLSYIRIRCNVKVADLSVQGSNYHTDNGVFDIQLPGGTYPFTVSTTDADFSPFEGSLDVGNEPFIEQDISLPTNVMHTLSIQSEKGSKLFVDGIERTGNGSATISLPAGLHEVEAVLGDWNLHATADLIRSDAALTMSFRTPVRMAYPLNATFIITPMPGALPPAKSNFKSGDVTYSLGDYTIRVEKKNYDSGQKTLSVDPGGEEIAFRMDALISKADKLYSGIDAAAPDYKKAVKEYEKLARSGDDKAQYALGLCYLDGVGTSADAVKGKEMIQKSMLQGNVDAALVYAERIASYSDQDSSYEHAAELGSTAAMTWLANRYFEKGSFDQALPYLLSLVELNDEEACCMLGDIYFDGLGREKDIVLAKQYYTIAASLYDNPHARERLADCKYFGFGEDRSIPDAIEDYIQLRDHASLSAKEKVALHYYQSGDYLKADPYLRDCLSVLSSRSDASDMFYKVGKNMYENEQYEKAAFYFNEAQKLGCKQINLFFWMGYMYSNAKGVSRDYSKSADYYEQGYRLGDAKCGSRLGRIYEQGNGRQKDLRKALSLYQEASRKGLAEADLYIGTLYSKDNGIGIDLVKSEQYWIRAAEKDNKAAINNLIKLYKSQKNTDKVAYWENVLRRLQ